MVRVGEITPNRLVAVTAGLALGLGVAACGSSSSSSSSSNVNKIKATPAATGSHLKAIDNEAASICAEAPFTLGEYKSQIGANAMAPLSFKKDPASGEFVFDSADANTTAEEVARAMGHNTLAAAIVFSELQVNNNGIVPANMAINAGDTFNQMAGNPTIRQKDCEVVVTSILTSPEQFRYHSHTGEIMTFTPEYDKNGNLANLNGKTTAQPKPTWVFNAGPLSGSADEALQKSTAENWGITPQGGIIATSEKEGNMKPSNTGKPAKVTTGGNVKMTTNGNVVHLSSGGSSSGTSGKGANGSGINNPSQNHGHTHESLPNGSTTGSKGKGPKGKGKEATPGKNRSPVKGGGSTTTTGGGTRTITVTGTGTTGTRTVVTTTGNQPPATTTHNQPPTTTTRTTTTPATTTTTRTTTTPGTTTSTTTVTTSAPKSGGPTTCAGC